MNTPPQLSTIRQAGFSLLEILVGLVIGLLVTLVIMQVFSVFEGQKRTTTGAADAQTNGSIALFMIANELKMAGYGLTPATDSPLNCTTLTYDTTGITDISPVTIIDGGPLSGASDSLKIRYSTSAMGGVPSTIAQTPTSNVITVENNLSCRKDDIVMMVYGTTCNLTYVSDDVTGTTTVTLHDITGDDAAVQGARLACLGSWVTTEFQVNPSYDPTSTTNAAKAYMERSGDPSVSDIVNIQAQYGVSDTPQQNQVTQWVNATSPWDAPTLTDRNRIKAIHIAVVARDGLYEKDVVTNTCTTNKGIVNHGPCAWDDTNMDAAPKIDLSNDPNWQHYRYRVFETIIPLRNMIWAASTL